MKFEIGQSWGRRLLAAAVVALLTTGAAGAGMGPCVPDDDDGLVCGTGSGAARVIERSRSPDGKFAFAWRDPNGPILAAPDGDLELVLVRLADGAVLTRSPTDYWAAEGMRANRLSEEVVWSPDSRLAVRAFQQRFNTGHFELHIRRGDTAEVVDLLEAVAPAVMARLSARQRRQGGWVLAAMTEKLTVANDGHLRFGVQLWVPKEGPDAYFDVALRVQTKAPRVRIVSVRPRTPPN